MKPTRNNKMLGIAVGERSMLVAELESGASSPRVLRTGEFRYPEGRTLVDAAELGPALSQFLKEHEFSTRVAVFGLPARWVLSKLKEMPALDEAMMADTLRLQAQGEFSQELGELVYDYASGTPARGDAADGSTTRPVLLVAVPKKYVDQISALAEAARIRVHAVIPFSTAIVTASTSADDLLTLVLGPSGVEFTSSRRGVPGVVRYVGASADASPPTLLSELRRASAHLPAAAGAKREVVLWNDSGSDEAPLRTLGESMGLSFRDGRAADLGVSPSPPGANGRDFGTAVSLARTGLSSTRTIDFADSRLAPPPEKRVDRRTVLAVLAGIVVLAGLGWWGFSLHSRQADVDAEVARNTDDQPHVDAAKAAVTKIEFASRWHADSPRFVSCLTDLTAATPPTPDLYAVRFTLKSDMKGQIIGKATSGEAILALNDRLNNSRRFAASVLSTHKGDNARGPMEITFTIDFTYLPR